MNEVLLALRRLARDGVASTLVIFTLAVGVGFAAAVFSFVDALFFDSLPVGEPDRLVVLYGLDEANPGYLPFSLPNFEDLADRQSTLSEVSVYQFVKLNLGGTDRPEKLTGQVVSENFFDLLRIAPVAGRWFDADDVDSVVIGRQLATRLFDQEPRSAIGRDVLLGRRSYTVVGVAPESFTGIGAMGVVAETWFPMSAYQQVSRFGQYERERSARVFGAIARLADGASRPAAEANLQNLMVGLATEYPDINTGLGVAVRPLDDTILDPNQRESYVLGARLMALLGLLLLLLVCANVANLQMLRSEARKKERAIRVALGAGPGNLSRQIAAEGLVVAVLGGGLGLGLALLLQRLVWAQRPPSIMAGSLEIDFGSRVVLFALAAAFLACLVASSFPLREARQTNLAAVLKSTPESPSAEPTRFGLREILLAVQVAVALLVLTAAGLFGRNLGAATSIETGFATDQLAFLRYDTKGEIDGAEAGTAFGYGLIERVEALPGVRAAALAAYPPLEPFATRTPYDDGTPSGADGSPRLAEVNSVSAGYFAAAGIPLVAGREFRRTDDATSLPTAIVNQTLAEQLWPAGQALDQTIWLGPERLETRVVGVAADSKYSSLGESPKPYVYLPFSRDYRTRMTLYVRAVDDPAAVLETVRRVAQEAAPSLPLTEIQTMRARLGDSLWAARLAAVGSATVALVCLLLATVGIYGIVGFNVRQRHRETGIRLAAGGRPAVVVAQVLRRSLRGFGPGVVLGLLATGFGLRLARNLLYGLSPLDPVSIAIALALVLVGTLIAIARPARFLAQTDPVTVLRDA